MALVVAVSKMWEAALLVIVVCLAAKLIMEVVQPFVPLLIGAAIALTVGKSLIMRRKTW